VTFNTLAGPVKQISLAELSALITEVSLPDGTEYVCFNQMLDAPSAQGLELSSFEETYSTYVKRTTFMRRHSTELDGIELSMSATYLESPDRICTVTDEVVEALVAEAYNRFMTPQYLVMIEKKLIRETWAVIDLESIRRYRSNKGVGLGVFKSIPAIQRLTEYGQKLSDELNSLF
jgi:hypothetical protein